MGKKDKIYKKKKNFVKKISKKINTSDERTVNKKALFNRYRDKQKLKNLESKQNKLKQLNKIEYSSESEQELTSVEQLLSTFRKKEVKQIGEDFSESSYESDDSDTTKQEERQSTLNRQSNLNQQVINETESYEEAENESISCKNLSEENDPYSIHYQHELSDSLLTAMTSSKIKAKNTVIKWPLLGSLSFRLPEPLENSFLKKTMLLNEDVQYAKPGDLPKRIHEFDCNKLNILTRFRSRIASANKEILARNEIEDKALLSCFQKEIFSIMNNYQDIYYPEIDWRNIDEIKVAYCLHAANHVMKNRSVVVKNDSEISQYKNSEIPSSFRDQGLVRPTVLILVPFRSSAFKVVKLLGTLCSGERGELGNGQRFSEEYTGKTLQFPTVKPKPDDYELLFSGNTDDNFKLGMAVTKKTLKLYTDFYSSDIIVASPLGLRTLIGADGESDRDYDFLNSLEIVIVDQADVLFMQNWEHVLHVFQHMHLQPQTVRNTDFSRVREWAVNGWMKYYRQTLLFSSVDVPELWNIMSHHCNNYAGRVRISNPFEFGSIKQVALPIPQFFHRFKADSYLSSVESRFEYFVKEILPRQSDPLMGHTMIFVPSYFDYVKLRNYFKKEELSFVQICEYSKDNKVARARDMFFHSEARFLLYSERAHFYHRRRIKGIRHLIFYQPPTLPHFYSEIINLMQEANQNKYGGSECSMSSTVIYCKYDMSRLAALVGTKRATSVFTSEQSTHMLITGQ